MGIINTPFIQEILIVPKRYFIIAAFFTAFLNIFIADPASAHRPLTTQGAYPVGIHRINLENGIKYTNLPEGDEAYNLDIELNYGVINNLDVGIEVPYVFWRPGDGEKIEAIGDMILKSRLLFLKGREGNPISLTVQPFFKVPTPEDKLHPDSGKGLSTGETDFGFILIATRETAPVIAHLNLGYVFINRPSGRDYENVFTFKLALEYKEVKELEVVGELTGETNKDPGEDDLFSILIGARYRLKDGILVDVGYGIGLSDSSPDSVATMGLTLDF